MMILRTQLHDLFKMAWNQTRKSTRLWSLAEQKISYSLNQVILISEPQKRLTSWRLYSTKFDDHVSCICLKVSAQINARNRLKTILPLQTKESLYRSFIVPNFYSSNQVWHHCGKRNTTKIEKVNERALRYVCNDKHANYQHLLERIRLPSIKTQRIQDMLLTINNSISNKAPQAIRNLINLRSFKYNLKPQEYVLSLPKVNITKYGLKSWRYFAAKKWNELSKDIRIKVGTSQLVNIIRSLNFGD